MEQLASLVSCFACHPSPSARPRQPPWGGTALWSPGAEQACLVCQITTITCCWSQRVLMVPCKSHSLAQSQRICTYNSHCSSHWEHTRDEQTQLQRKAFLVKISEVYGVKGGELKQNFSLSSHITYGFFLFFFPSSIWMYVVYTRDHIFITPEKN